MTGTSIAATGLEVEENTFENSPLATALPATASSGTIPIEGGQGTRENGTSITSKILTDYYIDSFEIPFLLLDGHGSRFRMDFLINMKNSEHTKRFVSICVPYSTSFWQVTDSNKQNSTFKNMAPK